MKPNYKTTFAALALFSIAHAHAGEVKTLTSKRGAPENAQTAVLTLAAGESAEFKWGGLNNYVVSPQNLQFSITIGEMSYTVGAHVQGTSPTVILPLKVSGPATITMNEVSDTCIATFDVTRVGTASPPAEIPQEAGSKFDVILEQSSDLLNWTPANPGEYTGTETKRFFRTRIVKK